MLCFCFWIPGEPFSWKTHVKPTVKCKQMNDQPGINEHTVVTVGDSILHHPNRPNRHGASPWFSDLARSSAGLVAYYHSKAPWQRHTLEAADSEGFEATDCLNEAIISVFQNHLGWIGIQKIGTLWLPFWNMYSLKLGQIKRNKSNNNEYMKNAMFSKPNSHSKPLLRS